MAGSILPISGTAISQPIAPTGSSRAGGAFQDVLTSAIQRVEGVQQNASQSVERFLSGEGEDLHTAALATAQADLSFNMFLQIRNKVVNAYQEIMRLPV